MSKIIKRQISKEDQVIGNLKAQFNRPTVHAQRQIGISPGIATGNIVLAYHRGKALGEHETIKKCIRALKGKFPKAATYIKENIKSIYNT